MNNLYLVVQNGNHDYDTYSDFVVCSKDIDTAANYGPHGETVDWEKVDKWTSWAFNREDVGATYVGIAAADLNEGDIVCSSYNAG